MANNLHISYDLNSPGKNYDRLISKIKNIGKWAKVHKSFWYVKSNLTAAQAVEELKPFIDANDVIYVVDATNNVAAWNKLPKATSEGIQYEWIQ